MYRILIIRPQAERGIIPKSQLGGRVGGSDKTVVHGQILLYDRFRPTSKLLTRLQSRVATYPYKRAEYYYSV